MKTLAIISEYNPFHNGHNFIQKKAKEITKPAEVETGAVINVPVFVNEGDVIKIDTRKGEYLSRV